MVLAPILMLGLAVPAWSAEGTFGTLRGRVVSAADGEPVAHARLRLTAYGMTAVADDFGVYVFTGVPVGATTLIVDAPGFRTYTQNIQVFGSDQTLDVLLTPLLPPPPAPAPVRAPDPMVARLLLEYGKTTGHSVVGLDLLTFGVMQRDAALGFPKAALGGNFVLGITWRFYRIPSDAEVERVAEQVQAAYSLTGGLSWQALRREVRAALNRRWFTYFGINTAALLVPAMEWGGTLDFAGPEGFGLQVNLSLVWGLWTALVPIPWVGLTFTF